MKHPDMDRGRIPGSWVRNREWEPGLGGRVIGSRRRDSRLEQAAV
jgi:hypothetical protein